MAIPPSHKIVSSKIDILVEQRDSLQAVVDEANEVIQLSVSWLGSDEKVKHFTFAEVNKMIEDKLVFLGSSNCMVVQEKSQQETAVKQFSSQCSLLTDKRLSDDLKTVMSQVKVMQDAMSFLSTSSENMSEKQLAMEKLVESLSDKYSKVEEEKLREIERELEGIKEKDEKAVIQQDKRMTSFEKKIQDLTDTQSDIIENCHQQQIKIKDQKKETEKLKTQSQQFTKDLSDALKNFQALNTQISALENKAAINTQTDDLENKVQFLEGDSEALSIKYEEVDYVLKELTRTTEAALEALSTRLAEHNSSLEQVTKRIDETTKQSSAQEREFDKMQKVEDKISALEKNLDESLCANKKLYDSLKTKHEMACQTITNRLVPLERLRNIFNSRLELRKGNLKRLEDVCSELTDFKKECLHLETQREKIGFSVLLCCTYQPQMQAVATRLSKLVSNEGNHFDPETAVFTAPLDGLYAVSVAVKKESNGCPHLVIRKQPCICFDKARCHLCCVGQILSWVKMSDHPSLFVVVSMKKNENLYLECVNEDYQTFIFCSLELSCFKIF